MLRVCRSLLALTPLLARPVTRSLTASAGPLASRRLLASRALPAAFSRPTAPLARLCTTSTEPVAPADTTEPTTNTQTETIIGQAQSLEFQAETRKLLDIVARSLYTDKEVFVRELVSNASDALEKLRHREVAGQPVSDPYLQAEIQISVNDKTRELVIHDFGIGMSRDELITNLGTIAHSGTQEFVRRIQSTSSSGADASEASNLIGQFGVGFYSTFMVADKVTVYSRSAEPDSLGHVWASTGDGRYEIAEATGVTRGTKIVIQLKEDCKEFAEPRTIEEILKKHSNFVNFDIKVNGKKVNTIKALWTLPKGQVTDEQHREFYQFIAHAYDTPLYRLHYVSDTPFNLQSLLYVPEQHTEKYGVGRMEPGVSLFCRKVLIQSRMAGLLPGWLRFIKGVVDCEGIPLNLSREHLQDSQIIRRLGSAITRRLIKHLNEQAKNDPQKYFKFFEEFGTFLKEGVASDPQHKEEIARLLRMESSATNAGDLTSLDEYVGRMAAEQKDIFYLISPNREFAMQSPYFEGFQKRGLEVLFLYAPIDDFVMNSLQEYQGKRIKSIESAESDPGDARAAAADEGKADVKLAESEVNDLCEWLKQTLEHGVVQVKATKRLVNSPAIIVDHESAAMRRMMRMADPQNAPKLPKQVLEINDTHPIILKLNTLRTSHPDLGRQIAEQVFDNALIAAGLLDDPRSMLPRLNQLLERIIDRTTSA